MTIQAEIEAIVGSVLGSDATDTAGFCVEGVKYVTKALATNAAIRDRLTSSSNVVNNDGFTITNTVGLSSVNRKDASNGRFRMCGRVSFNDSFNALDPDSIYFATKTDPKYYINEDKVFILPVPTSDELGMIKHITPATSVTISGSVITNLSSEYIRGVVLYAALQVIQKRMNAIDKPTGALNLTALAQGDVTGTQPLAQNTWFDIVDDYIKDEDVELASTYMSKINSYINNYQAELAADRTEYQWYESKYLKISQQLIEFLRMYMDIPMQPTGVVNEASAND